MLDQYSISDDIQRHSIDLMVFYRDECIAQLEDALVTACSCVAAGVPMSDVFVQQYQEASILNGIHNVTIVGFDPMTPVKTRSTIYRLV